MDQDLEEESVLRLWSSVTSCLCSQSQNRSVCRLSRKISDLSTCFLAFKMYEVIEFIEKYSHMQRFDNPHQIICFVDLVNTSPAGNFVLHFLSTLVLSAQFAEIEKLLKQM